MLVGLLYSLIALNFCAADSAPPFWKAKEKYIERVKDGEILVAVKSQKSAHPDASKQLTIHGGGHVRAPAKFVFAQAQDYKKVASLSGYIEKADFDASQGVLKMEIAAYGYRTEMDVKLVAHPPTAAPASLDYEILRGPLKGLRGAFSFVDIATNKSEVGMTGDYRYADLPIPKIFLEFGMEVIFQKMAARLRRHVETEYKGNP